MQRVFETPSDQDHLLPAVLQSITSKSCVLVWCIYKIISFPGPGKLADRTSRDYLLGTVTIPTRDLLTRRSGNTAVLCC